MKISNSKKELARIISENGGWCDVAEWSALEQQGGEVWLCALKPLWNAGIGIFSFKDHVKIIPGSYKLPNIHQTILSRAEYFHLYPAPDADGWIEWKGGEIDIDDMQLVDYRMACTPDGKHRTSQSMNLVWDKHGEPQDIIAYRLHKPEIAPDAQETNPVPAPEAKPTIEQLAADYRSARDCADSKQQEADAAKADAEAKLADLVAAGKALGLVLSVVADEPELVITDWRDLQERDVIWFCGDDEQGEGEYSVLEVEHRDYGGQRAVRIDTIGNDYWIDVSDDWRFIRRP